MQIYGVNNLQQQFTGLKFSFNTDPVKLAQSEFRNNKEFQFIDKALDRMGLDMFISGMKKGEGRTSDLIWATIKTAGNPESKNFRLIPNPLAVVSGADERVVRYPLEGGSPKFVDVMYDTASDAEKMAWEYNFGEQIAAKVKAGFDVAKEIVGKVFDN